MYVPGQEKQPHFVNLRMCIVKKMVEESWILALGVRYGHYNRLLFESCPTRQDAADCAIGF